ncbi:helix-turn-helix domain-containing protein [Pseudomonas cavernicola]|uniref:Helix-turn-helix domain-containing protein n=1 Tax=Pseudomonas cavernicola TaxID=2320866 RepID=A0A418X997_9PSED|nr:helix-turn-helix domain-containing protein [Pseudomonas cavernicola]RJG09050.1 helix-turn-helix domain-containing protein [Pseudomonas cavernicola]
MRADAITPDLRFLLLPLPGFAMLPFGGFLDKLRFTGDEEDYSRQRYCTWTILGQEAGQVESSSGAAVRVEVTPANIRFRDYDYLVLFGGRSASATEALAPTYRRLLRDAAAQGVKLVTIDNACFLLAACGLLAGHKVAVHWRHEQEFRASYPRIPVVSEQLYCIDGNRISCAGGLAAIDLVVELLARGCGRTRALKGLADMLVDETRSSQHQLKSREATGSGMGPVDRAIALMRLWMASDRSIEQLAAGVDISRRQLDRRFRASHGVTASAYWAEMRLRHVQWRLLNSSHSLALIADEIGVTDTSYLAKIVRKRFGVTPAALRKEAVRHPEE